MMRVRPSPSVSAFANLVDQDDVIEMEEYAAALSMFDEMPQSGKPINVYTMTITINWVDFGFSMLGCIFKLGYKPDASTFTTHVKGLCLDDKVIGAEKHFYKLLALNLSVSNEVMIDSLICGLCKAGCTSRACVLLELVEGTSRKPDVCAYSTAFDSLCKDGMAEYGRWLTRAFSPSM